MKLLKFFVFIIWAFILGYAPFIHAKNLSWQNDKVKIDLYQQNDTSGQNTQILVHFTLLDGWHISWENPGDAGVPTKFSWQLPAGVQIAKQNQSVPEKFLYDDILTQFGYSNEAYYLFEATANSSEDFGKKPGIHTSVQPTSTEKTLSLHTTAQPSANTDKTLELQIEWTACREYCKPETADFVLNLDQENIPSASWTGLLNKARQTFPLKLSKPAQAQYDKDILQIRLPHLEQSVLLENNDTFYFIPFEDHLVSPDTPQQISFLPKAFQISVESEKPGVYPTKGLLINKTQSIMFDIAAQADPYPYLRILFFAFLGGLILNLMPCVLPILSLKLISLGQSVHKTGHKKHALLYMSGVLLCFALIAALLYLFKNTGEQIGWGFQLQSPVFISFLLLFFVLMLLLMWDLVRLPFNIGGKLSVYASANSFLTGFFAVLVASPCTGPFMGAALGYALLEPPHTYFPIFLTLGFGYALPFTLIEMYPHIIKKYLPRPGKWMTRLKFILSVPVFFTCLWLGWILYHQLSKPSLAEDTWKPYNEEQIEDLLAQGKPVFIEFTAKWCLSCLLNEQSTLHTKKFTDYAAQKNITLFRADWTNQNDQISQSLEKYGRNSVPLYVYYPENAEKYRILPQILSPKIIFEALE